MLALYAVLLGLVTAQQVGDYRPDWCPTLVCGDLNADHNVVTPNLPWLCAKGQDPTKIIIDSCPEGLYCDTPESFIMNWDPRQPFTFEVTCNSTLQDNPYSLYTDKTVIQSLLSGICSQGAACDDRLAIGTNPKTCYSDDDCLRLNGQSGSCLCGSDGNKYCSMSDGDLPERVEAACEGNMERFLYWDMYKRHYAFVQGAPICLGAVFHHVGLLGEMAQGQTFNQTEYEAVEDSGAALALALWLALA